MSGGDWKEMLTAAEKGDLPLLEYHIKQGIDPNYQHPEVLSTPMIEASRYGHFEIVKFLLENGADPKIEAVWEKRQLFLLPRRIDIRLLLSF